MQRLANRYGLQAVVGVVVACILVGVASLILAAGYRNQVGTLKHAIYTRCTERADYDQRTDEWKAAIEDYYTDLLSNIRTNAPHDAFYRRLRVRVETVIAKGRLAQDRPTGCEQYR